MWTVKIDGPGIDSKIEVRSLDDLAVIRAMLEKIERQLIAQVANT